MTASAVTFASSNTCESAAGVCSNGVADDVSDRLLDQGGVGLHQRQVLRQPNVDALARAVPSRRIHHALGDFPQVDPVAPQLQRTRIDAGDRQKIADHLVEILGSPS